MGIIFSKCFKKKLIKKNSRRKSVFLEPISKNFQYNNMKLDLKENNKGDKYFDDYEIKYYENLWEKEKVLYDIKKEKLNFNIREGNLVGSGSFGTVIFGFDSINGLMIAIKRISLGNNENGRDMIDEIEREVELLSELKHDDIVKYIGSEKEKNILKIYLEYAEGGSLSSILSKYFPLSEETISLYCKQILLGLEYLHYHNVIHMDIKCANVLVNKLGICRWADFGSSKKITGLMSEKDSLRGTINYMAPEVLARNHYERYADIWSFGCTVYELFTGKPPWSNENNIIKFTNILVKNKLTPDIPKNISLEAQDFLKCCLQIEPKKRFNVYKLLRHPFILGYLKSNETKNKNKNEINSITTPQTQINSYSIHKNKNYFNFQDKTKSLDKIQINKFNEKKDLILKKYGIKNQVNNVSNKEINEVENINLKKKNLNIISEIDNSGYLNKSDSNIDYKNLINNPSCLELINKKKKNSNRKKKTNKNVLKIFSSNIKNSEFENLDEEDESKNSSYLNSNIKKIENKLNINKDKNNKKDKNEKNVYISELNLVLNISNENN